MQTGRCLLEPGFPMRYEKWCLILRPWKRLHLVRFYKVKRRPGSPFYTRTPTVTQRAFLGIRKASTWGREGSIIGELIEFSKQKTVQELLFVENLSWPRA